MALTRLCTGPREQAAKGAHGQVTPPAHCAGAERAVAVGCTAMPRRKKHARRTGQPTGARKGNITLPTDEPEGATGSAPAEETEEDRDRVLQAFRAKREAVRAARAAQRNGSKARRTASAGSGARVDGAAAQGGEGGFGRPGQDGQGKPLHGTAANFRSPPMSSKKSGNFAPSQPQLATQAPRAVAHRSKHSLTRQALSRIGVDGRTLRIARQAGKPGLAGTPQGGGFNLPQARKVQLAALRLLALRTKARNHLPTFIDLVMREEHSRRQVLCAPHQRVLLDFVWAHPQCVVRMPVGTSKTWCMAALALHLLGRDPTERGALLSATQAQAQKPLSLVASYLKDPELSTALRMVFPGLQPSPRVNDKWTQTAVTVMRPPGIRDPSLVAVGLDGNLPGSRLSWIVVDDVLSRENTDTPASLQKTIDYFFSTVMSRLDPGGDARCIVTNTPWHPKDITYALEDRGWPTLTMDVAGGIHINNADDWDSPDIRPSRRPGEWYRLTAHDTPHYDHDEVVPLWPERYSAENIETIRAGFIPVRFNQLYMSQVRDDESARCKAEWFTQCKDPASHLLVQYTGTNPTVCGVDLGVGKDAKRHDKTVFFTIELLPNGKRRVIDVDGGHWDGPVIVKKLIEKHRAYNCIVRVENNAAQDYLLQFVRESNAAVPVKPHVTGRNKSHPEFGVEALFAQLQNKAWIIPAYANGTVPTQVAHWQRDCLDYEPGKHTGDYLMAAWFANEQARALGYGVTSGAGQSTMPATFAMSLLSR